MSTKQKQKAAKAAAKAAKKCKQELKTEKGQRKKEARELEGEEDIKLTVARLEKKAPATTSIVSCEQPGPRSNFSICQSPISDEIVMFGGQYFDGATQHVYGDTFRWNFIKNEWRQVLCGGGPTPTPRSCHQAVVHKHCMYVFGGEYSTLKQFYHFRDLWKFDLKSNSWTEIRANGGPCPRSGHRMLVWKQYIVVFGGFHDTFRDCKYYNDLFVFHLAEERWEKIDVSTVSVPCPRSGCGFFAHPTNDTFFVYGGYVRDKKVSGTDLNDMWQLNLRVVGPSVKATWERLSKKGAPPSRRSGASFAVHKHRALVFGGVFDKDTQGLVLESEFFNELYAFDMDRKRWYVLDYHAPKQARRRRRETASETRVEILEEEEIVGKFEWIFEYVDEHGNSAQIVMNDEAEHTVCADPVDPQNVCTDTGLTPTVCEPLNQSGISTVCSLKNLAPKVAATVTLPPERMGASMFVVGGNTLCILGGISEIKDKEVTYDDCWTLDLNVRDQWSQKLQGTMEAQVWLGEEESEGDDEEWSDRSSSDDSDSSDDEDDDASEENDEPIKAEQNNEPIKSVKKSLKDKMAQIRSQHDLNESYSALVGESLKDFFARTAAHWTAEAMAATTGTPTPKEIRRDAFALAGKRFESLAPILAKLKEYEEEQIQQETTSRKKTHH